MASKKEIVRLYNLEIKQPLTKTDDRKLLPVP